MPGLSVLHRVRAEVAAELGERGLALQEALQAFRLLPSDLANAITLAPSPESQGVLRQAGGTLGP